MNNFKLIYAWISTIWLYLLNVIINFNYFNSIRIFKYPKYSVSIILINLLILIIAVLCYPKNKKKKWLFYLLMLGSLILSLYLMPFAIFIPLTLVSTFKEEQDTEWRAIDWTTITACIYSFFTAIVVAGIMSIMLVFTTDAGTYNGFYYLGGWVFQLPAIIIITVILGLKKHWIWFLFPVIFIFPFICVGIINHLGL